MATPVQIRERLERRALPLSALAFALGAGAGLVSGLSGGVAKALLGLAAVALWLAARSPRYWLPWVVMAWLVVGLARGVAAPTAVVLEAPLARYFDRTVTVVAEPVDLPARSERGIQVPLRSSWIRAREVGGGQWHRVQVRLRVSLPPGVPEAAVAAGTPLLVRGRLRPFRNSGNPGALRSADLMHRRGLVAALYVTDPVWVRPLASAVLAPTPARRLLAFRMRAVSSLRAALPPVHASVAAALLVGDRSAVDARWRERFVRTGTAHLLAISGLHVGLVGLVAYRGVRALIVRVPALVDRGVAPAWAAALALLPVAAYVVLSGGRAPALRAGVAVELALVAVVLGRRARPLHALAAAAIGMIAVDPRAVSSVSVLLSFSAATAMLLIRGSAASRSPPGDCVAWIARRVVEAARFSAVATVATAPFVAASFGSLSFLGLIVNPLVVPLVASLAVPVGLLGLVLLPLSEGAAALAFRLAELPLAAGLAIVAVLEELPFGSLAVPEWPPGLALVVAALVLVALGRRGRRVLLPALLAFGLAMTPCLMPRRTSRALDLVFLSVGRGDAVLLGLPDGTSMLVDAGPVTRGGFDAGERIIVPALQALGISRLDLVVITHAHLDHLGGLPAVLAAVPVREVWLPYGSELPAPVHAALEEAVTRGTRVLRLATEAAPRRRGGVEIQVLHPPRARGPGARSENDRSLVLRILHGRDAVLLTGDISVEAEARLLASGRSLDASVLKVAHHGSRSSTSAAFLDGVQPGVAVVSSARGSPYHPHATVTDRLDAYGAELRVTGREGAVRIRIEGG